MFAKIRSATLHGIDALIVNVEVDLANGLPGWQIVGLPETMIKESKERVTAAIRNSGFQFATRKITINLAPADVKKHGTAFDLPIASALLAAVGMFSPEQTNGWLMAGELSLTGELTSIPGAISFAMAARDNKLKGLIVPSKNMPEASLVPDIQVIGVNNLADVVRFLKEGERPVHQEQAVGKIKDPPLMDFSDIKGQNMAKRAMEIAAAGNHHILLYGPPGTGKTMLAERLSTILPPLDYEEALETTRIYSLFGLINRNDPLISDRPIRAPHHSASYVGLVGGGSGIPRPGEISLAHNGVLFMDELPEFKRDVLECLRQPLEVGKAHISRAGISVTYPARFMFVAAMNPCKCGYFGHPTRPCICSVGQIESYRRKISGPLLDRLDLHVNVPPLPTEHLQQLSEGEPSSSILARVLKARQIQSLRYKKMKLSSNSQMTSRHLKEFCKLDRACLSFLTGLIEKMKLSARAYDRILRVSRTIADLEGADVIETNHLLEAAQFRGFDKEMW